MRETYAVNVERDGQFWLVHVPAIDRYTQARHLREVDEMARDLIGIMQDLQPEVIDLEVSVRIPDDAKVLLEASKIQREMAARATAEAARATRAAARLLAKSGLTVRDAGAVLGVSYQRAHQLIQESNLEEALEAAKAATRLIEDDAARKLAARPDGVKKGLKKAAPRKRVSGRSVSASATTGRYAAKAAAKKAPAQPAAARTRKV